MSTLRTKARPPKRLEFKVSPENVAPVDLSTVTGAVLKARHQHATNFATWSCVMTNQTSTSLTLVHTFAEDDVAKAGMYAVFATLIVPGGELDTEPAKLYVRDQFDVSD